MLEIRLDDSARAVLRQLPRLPAHMLRAIAAAMDVENKLTVGHIEQHRLSRRGPQTLGVVTNRLRSSVRTSRARIIGTAVESAIGTHVVYAGVHEFGFDGRVKVRAHTRRRFGRVQGAATFNFRTGRIRRGRIRKVQTGEVLVRAHTRQMRVKERAPIRRGLEDRADDYATALSAAIVRAWEGQLQP